jgi:hypothetical protein
LPRPATRQRGCEYPRPESTSLSANSDKKPRPSTVTHRDAPPLLKNMWKACCRHGSAPVRARVEIPRRRPGGAVEYRRWLNADPDASAIPGQPRAVRIF